MSKTYLCLSRPPTDTMYATMTDILDRKEVASITYICTGWTSFASLAATKMPFPTLEKVSIFPVALADGPLTVQARMLRIYRGSHEAESDAAIMANIVATIRDAVVVFLDVNHDFNGTQLENAHVREARVYDTRFAHRFAELRHLCICGKPEALDLSHCPKLVSIHADVCTPDTYMLILAARPSIPTIPTFGENTMPREMEAALLRANAPHLLPQLEQPTNYAWTPMVHRSFSDNCSVLLAAFLCATMRLSEAGSVVHTHPAEVEEILRHYTKADDDTDDASRADRWVDPRITKVAALVVSGTFRLC